jgi:recombination protein RecT
MATQQIVPAQGGALVQPAKKDIDALIKSEQFKDAVKKALPKHMTVDRFVRVALTAMMRTPKLRECSQESLFKCLLDLSMYGLEPDGRRAHLIPFKKNYKDAAGKWQSTMEVQLILDYKGIAELVRRSGDVSYIHADVVCSGDEFDYAYGTGAHLTHKPTLEGDRNPESAFCAYSFVKLKDGSEDFVVLSRGEVEKVRGRSKAKDDGPWVTDWSAMAAKTAFRRHSKWLPLSPEVRDAIEADDDAVDIVKFADTPDGDPAWLETGSTKAAQLVAAEKIAALESGNPIQQTADPKVEQKQAVQAEDKPYTDETLPDAMQVKVGTECLYEHGGKLLRLRVMELEGEAPTWKTVEEVSAKPQPQAAPAATPRQAPKFGRGK